MLVFKKRRKLEYPEKNLLEQRKQPTTNSTHTTRATLVGGECSQLCTTLTQLFTPQWVTGVRLFVDCESLHTLLVSLSLNISLLFIEIAWISSLDSQVYNQYFCSDSLINIKMASLLSITLSLEDSFLRPLGIILDQSFAGKCHKILHRLQFLQVLIF